MAYIRFGEGFYMYPHVDGGIECCWCELQTPRASVRFGTRAEAIAHVREHAAADGDSYADVIEEIEGDEDLAEAVSLADGRAFP